jgi:hypothetical protein
MNLMEVEAGRGNCDYDAVGELRELRAHFEVPYITNSYTGTVDRGFSSVSDPDSIRSVDLYPDSESGSRWAKITHKIRKKLRNFDVLKCWMFSFESGRLLL